MTKIWNNFITFNVNNPVRVKLTEQGHTILRDMSSPFAHAETDEQGYIEIQLWELMSIFGEHMYNGCEVPFETDIRMELK